MHFAFFIRSYGISINVRYFDHDWLCVTTGISIMAGSPYPAFRWSYNHDAARVRAAQLKGQLRQS